MANKNYHIYIGKTIDGEFVEKDLERDYPGLVFKSITGLTSYGAPVLYEEEFAEEEDSDVYFPSTVTMKHPDIVLTLYFIGCYADVSAVTDSEKYSAADESYRQFADFLYGSDLIYWDTIRNRKVKIYLNEAINVKTEKLYGEPYKEVSFTFKNKYGRSFSLSDPIFSPVYT